MIVMETAELHRARALVQLMTDEQTYVPEAVRNDPSIPVLTPFVQRVSTVISCGGGHTFDPNKGEDLSIIKTYTCHECRKKFVDCDKCFTKNARRQPCRGCKTDSCDDSYICPDCFDSMCGDITLNSRNEIRLRRYDCGVVFYFENLANWQRCGGYAPCNKHALFNKCFHCQKYIRACPDFNHYISGRPWCIDCWHEVADEN